MSHRTGTPVSILVSFARLFKRLVVPTPDETWAKARMGVRADLAWQPYLFLAIFYGTAVSVVFASKEVDPPGTDFEVGEWLWAITGIGAPVLAFVSVWLIVNMTGKHRYRALWMRLSADILAITSMVSFLYEHIVKHLEHPFDAAVVIASIFFISVLIWRDVRFLLVTEMVARSLHQKSVGER